jgi:hypothetical protein
MLLVSVAPEVKTISLESAPMISATFFGAVSLLFLIKVSATSHLPGIFDSLFGLPTVGMCAAVGIAILVGEIWEHGIQYPRIHRRCGLSNVRDVFAGKKPKAHLHIEINRSDLLSRRTIPLRSLQLEP